jgi:deoxyhypusine synthase
MLKTGFQGRKLAEAVEVWREMLEEKEITIVMGLSGAIVPAGMGKIISFFIKERMIDCLVSTGGNIFHDIHEALGGKHYLGTHNVDDAELRACDIDRIYDIFAEDKMFIYTESIIGKFARELEPRTCSSREFIYLLGKEIAKNGKESIITTAYEYKVPIFVPAFSDSSMGIGLLHSNLFIDQMKDVEEIVQIMRKAKNTGAVYIGGGVPKNFIQQAKLIARHLRKDHRGINYAIQFTTDSAQWGGLSGSTFEEAISWGKVSKNAKKVQVYVDATIALPIVSHSLMEKKLKRKAPLLIKTK